jgi:replicative DNA helicase
VVVDQLDKMSIDGTFARTDEKLRAIYTGAREIAKRRNCAIVAVSQASADAEGRYEVTFSMMENSRTGKAAEADLIIGVGKSDTVDSEDHSRGICISKNKITGWHGTIGAILDPQTSRYTI